MKKNNINNLLIIVVFIILISGFVIFSCTGAVTNTDEGICASADNYIECVRINNNRIPSFYVEFSMLFIGKGEKQNLEGMAYVDNNKKRYFIELSSVDVTMFKGTIVDDDIKILFRKDNDKFEGILGKLSKIDLSKYTSLDFEIETVLKILSLKIPIYDKYNTIEIDEENEKRYILIKDNVKDIIEFGSEYPQINNINRGIYQNTDLEVDSLIRIYQYKYRGYAKGNFEGKNFYYPQKTILTYNPIKEGSAVKEERREIHIGLKKGIEFKSGLENSVFEFEFPEGIKIHKEN